MARKERVYAAIRRGVRRVTRELGAGGGLVMETTKPILPDVPTENAVTCLETMLEEAGRPAKR